MKDLLEKMKSMELKVGLNIIDTNSDGISLLAQVKNGKIIGWKVQDSSGKELVKHHVQSEPSEKKKRCYICYETPDRIVCWMVPCGTGPMRPPN